MCFIPTFDPKVEQFKTEAKKLQRKGGGKDADLLNRVTRSAGYDHWHHVIQCNKQTKDKKEAETLLAECEVVVDAEQTGEIKVVMTGPNVDNAIGPFVLFSTGIGDAWMLDPEDDLCLCLMWRGQVNEPQISETPKQLKISRDGKYDLLGDFMHLRPFDERIRTHVVAGYPLQGIRSLIDKAQSFQRKFASVIEQDAIDLTEPVI